MYEKDDSMVTETTSDWDRELDMRLLPDAVRRM